MYTVPFTEDSVKVEICGRSMRVGVKMVGSPVVRNGQDMKLEEDGSNWSIEDGVLNLKDERGSTTYKVSGLEVLGGKVVLSGEVLLVAGKREMARMVMYEKSSLGTDFHVVVSSHIDYEEKTIPKLIRTLAMEGIPEERVVVVVGGCEGESTKEKGYTRVPVKGNLMGCTALLHLMSDECSISSSYIVLLHDTCEAVSGFEDAIKSFDIGLPFDVCSAHFEIGIWSMDFIRRLAKIDGFDLHKVGFRDLLSMILDLSFVRSVLPAPKHLKSRDVYGGGMTRAVFDIPELGVRKYSGRDMTGGRP